MPLSGGYQCTCGIFFVNFKLKIISDIIAMQEKIIKINSGDLQFRHKDNLESYDLESKSDYRLILGIVYPTDVEIKNFNCYIANNFIKKVKLKRGAIK